MECFLFPFYVGDLLATLLLRIVSQPSLITPRTREAENLPAPGKGGDRALRGARLCVQMRASSVASHRACRHKGGLCK